MRVTKKIDRYAAVRLQSLCLGKRQCAGPPMIFLGGMSRVGNHLLHSLLNGHKSINSIPDEDYLLRTNIGSVLNQLLLFYYFGFGDTGRRMDFLLKQNEDNFWLKRTNMKVAGHEVDFDLIDYDKFKSGLERLAGKKIFNLRRIYKSYIDCILDSLPDERKVRKDYSWKLYFTVNADFLIRPIMSWDARNRAIVPIRDPFQRFASHKKWEKRDFICTTERILGWEKVHRSYQFFRKKYKGRILFVDYAELVTDVKGVMKRIAGFLDIEFDDILIRPTLLGRTMRGNTSFSEDSGKTGEIYKKSLNRYRNILSRKEIDIIEREIRPIYLDLAGSRRDLSNSSL